LLLFSGIYLFCFRSRKNGISRSILDELLGYSQQFFEAKIHQEGATLVTGNERNELIRKHIDTFEELTAA